MADEIEQAQAATEQSPQTATENNAQETAANTAVDTSTNNQDTAATGPDVEGMDGDAYQKAAQAYRDGNPAVETPEATAPVAEPPKETVAKPDPNQDDQTKKTGDEDDKDNLAPNRQRLTALSEQQRMAVKLTRDLAEAGTPISLAEAERRVSLLYGTPEKTEAAAQQQAEATTVDAINANLTDLRTQYRQAAKDVDTERMADLQEKIEAERDRLEAARREQTAAQESANAAADAKLTEAKTELRRAYPDFAKKDSALSLKWNEIHEQMQAEQNPILNDPVAATRYITFLAADELGISPVRKGTQQASPSTPSTPVKQQPAIQPASGALRTAAPSNQTDLINKQIDAVQTQDEYEQLKKSMLNPAR